MRLVHGINRIFNRRFAGAAALDRIAGDPVALAEILLLFRVVLIDGLVSQQALAVFERVVGREFGIGAEALPELHRLLESPAGQAVEADLFGRLDGLDGPARTRLIGMMREILEANSERRDQARRLVAVTARLLRRPRYEQEG